MTSISRAAEEREKKRDSQNSTDELRHERARAEQNEEERLARGDGSEGFSTLKC